MSEKSPIFAVDKKINTSADMATKILINSNKVLTFAPVFYIDEVFQSQLADLIDNFLGLRGSTPAAFRYSEVVQALMNLYLCGGDYIEDLNTRFRQELLRPEKEARVPSSDTVGKAMKALAEANKVFTGEKSQKEYHFNFATRLNELLIRAMLRTGQLKEGQEIDVDFDHVFEPNEKKDSTFSYKMANGYFPGVLMMGNLVLGIVCCDGNNNVRFHQKDILHHFFTLLETVAKVKIRRFRADCGSYSEDVITEVTEHCQNFYIRVSNCQSRYAQFEDYKDWAPAKINDIDCEVASFDVEDILPEKKLRLVVQRTEVPPKPNELQIFEGPVYEYRAIVTDDWVPMATSVIRCYNQRGEWETTFDRLNNDFGWKHMPFSFMGQNTAFMILTAMIMNFYFYMLGKLVKFFGGLTKTCRIKRFMFTFLCCPGKWVHRSRQWFLTLYTDKPYDKLVAV